MWKSDPGSTHPANSLFLFCPFSCTPPLSSCPFLFFWVLISLAFSLPLSIVAPSLTDCHSLLPLLNLISLLPLHKCLFISFSSALHLPCAPVSLFLSLSPSHSLTLTLSPSSCCCTWNLQLSSSVWNKPLRFPFLFRFLSPQTPGERVRGRWMYWERKGRVGSQNMVRRGQKTTENKK